MYTFVSVIPLKILRMIVDASWYVSIVTLHADLGISYPRKPAPQNRREENRRLKRNWPNDRGFAAGRLPIKTL
jgi:hypothetical protein